MDLACQVHGESAEVALQRMCSFLPAHGGYRAGCRALVLALAPLIAQEIATKTSPDSICYRIGLCWVEKKDRVCHLFPLPSGLLNRASGSEENFFTPSPALPRWALPIMTSPKKGVKFPWVCFLPGVKELCNALHAVYWRLTPAVDLDGDLFSPVMALRGALWRGRDCDDFDQDVRPGRRPKDGDKHRGR